MVELKPKYNIIIIYIYLCVCVCVSSPPLGPPLAPLPGPAEIDSDGLDAVFYVFCGPGKTAPWTEKA